MPMCQALGQSQRGLRLAATAASARHTRYTRNCLRRSALLGHEQAAAAAAAMADAAAAAPPPPAAQSGGFVTVVLTCAAMFGAAAGAGMLPAALPASNQRLTSSLSTVGAGLLLGSALAIILPEGFEAAHEAEPRLPAWATSLALLAGWWVMMALESLSHWLPGSSGSGSRDARLHRHLSDADAGGEDEEALLGAPPSPFEYQQRQHQQQQQQHEIGLARLSGPQHSAQAGDAHGHTTVLLPGGEERPGSAAATTAGSGSPRGRRAAASAGGSSAGAPEPSQRRLASSSGLDARQGSHPAGAAAGHLMSQPGSRAASAIAAASSSSRGPDKPGGSGGAPATAAASGGGATVLPWLRDPAFQALIALLVHAVSDGLAVGAASLSELPQISVGVAFAMVMHKGPVAIGLATLLRSHWTRAQVHRGVLAFAAASPLAALVTYGLLSRLPLVATAGNIALLLLFSGGTVLYAASQHIQPGSSKAHDHGGGGGSSLGLITAGMLAPVLLSALLHEEGHGH